MRRVLRHLFTFAAGVSLLLCVAAGVLCVRCIFVGSQRVVHRDYVSDGDRISLVLAANADMVWFGDYRMGFPKSVEEAAWDAVGERSRPAHQFFRNHGFMLHKVRYDTPYGAATCFVAGLPHWLVIMLASIVPGVWLRRWRRGRQRGHDARCPACGYDLRASPTRCPECGTPAPASPASPAKQAAAP